jgi:hypothetical protein
MDRAIGVLHGLAQPGHAGTIGDVGLNEERPSTAGPNEVLRFLAGTRVDFGNDYRRAQVRQHAGGFSANALARTGDNRYAARQRRGTMAGLLD